MIRKLMASSAMLALISAGAVTIAQAQTDPGLQPAPAEALAPVTELAASEQVLTPAQPTLATVYIGKSVYSSEDPESDNIGDVNDLIVSEDGTITHAVIGVGGFLGMGEKDVAVPFDELKVVEGEGDIRLIYSSTREQLEAAPALDRSAFDPTAVASNEAPATGASPDAMAPAPSDQMAVAPESEAPADDAAAPAEEEMATAPAEEPAPVTGEQPEEQAAAGTEAAPVEEPAPATEEQPEELAAAPAEEPATAAEEQPEEMAAAPAEEPATATEKQPEELAAAPTEEAAPATEEQPEELAAAQAEEPVTATEEQPEELAAAPAEEPATATEEQPEEMAAAPAEEPAAATEEQPEELAAAPAEEPATAAEEQPADAVTAEAPTDEEEVAAAEQPAEDSAAAPSEGFIAFSAEQVRASDLIGQSAYSGEESIGEISDLVLQDEGEARAAVIDVGGFLGAGEKTVGIPFDQLQISKAEDGSEQVTVAMSKEELDQLPAIEPPAEETAAVEQPIAPEPTAPATGLEEPATTGSIEAPITYEAVTQDIAASRLIDAVVYGPDDASIGEISDLLFDKTGTIEGAVIDVGGFLGMGEKPVAVPFDSLKVGESQSGTLTVMVSATQEELDSAPVYEEPAPVAPTSAVQ